MDLINIAILIVLFANFIFGLFIFLKGAKKTINIFYSILIFTVMLWAVSMIAYRLSPKETSIFWAKILYFSASLIPTAFLYFNFLFPAGKIPFDSIKRILILLPNILLAVLIFWNGLVIKDILMEPGQEKEIIWGPAYYFYVFFVSWYFIWGFFVLYKKYQKAVGILKMQIRYILIGSLFSIAFGSGFNLFLPTLGEFSLNWLGQVTTFIWISFTGYAIVKYRFLDIRLVLGRWAIWIFSLVAVIVLAFLLMFLNNLLLQPLPLNISGPLIIIVSLLLFQPIFRVFEKFASKYFYYTFYSYQTVLTELGEKLTQLLDLDDLASVITNTLLKTMKLERVVILLRDQRTGNYKIKKNIGFREENGISLVKDNFLTKFLEETKKPLVYEELSLIIKDTKNEKEKEKFEKLKNNMKRIEARLCLPLLIEGKIIGLIVMGNKLSGESYSIQDLELLTGLANQSSIALQNAKLYSEVQELSKNLERRVKEQVKQIEELSEMKSEFLKVVNHQLRTPVSIIKGMASMLAEGSLKGEKRDEFIKKIYLSSERLETILDDILLAQSLAGRSEPVKFSPCQIEEVIEKQFEHLKTQAEMKNLKMVFIKPEDKLPVVLADSEMLQKAISRLIDNAILYTNKGEIKISADLRKEGEKDFIEISIQDSGLGLEKDDQKNLFKLFYRGEKATLMHPNGSGLGLFIVKEIINSHQGRVEVQSDGIGKGATFKIILPIITEV